MSDLVRGVTLNEFHLYPKIAELIHKASVPLTFDSSEATPRERYGWRHRSLEGVLRHTASITIKGADGTLFMTRYILGERSDGGHIYANCIHRPDIDELPHDHPWDAEALILLGSYTQEIATATPGDFQPGVIMAAPPKSGGQRRYQRIHTGQTNILPHGMWHRIIDLHGHPTWTLMITSPKKHSWGFREWSTGGKVYHKGFTEWKNILHDLRLAREFQIVEEATRCATVFEGLGLIERTAPTGFSLRAHEAIPLLQLPPA